MIKILIIEDDTDINHMIRACLEENGYETAQAFSGTEGKLLFEMAGDFDLVLMDLMLPGISGEELLAGIRRISSLPVIVLSAKSGLSDKVDLLGAGADDYLTKPFALEELLARIQVQLRRRGAVSDTDTLTYGRWRLDRDQRRLFVSGAPSPVELTLHEYQILELLMRRPKKVFTKQEIYETVWEQDYAIEDKTINVHISNIRSKLKATGTADYIKTVWGIGFKMEPLC